jgi:hypothetical protein
VLVIGLSAVGLGMMTTFLDFLLLPALVIFIGITVYALKGKNTGVENG